MTARDLCDLIDRHAFVATSERDLHDALTIVFIGAGFPVRREVRVGPGERLDLLVDGVAVEIKLKGSWRDVDRQLARYAEHPEVRELLLVTAKAGHRHVAHAHNGKRVTVKRPRLAL